MEDSTSEGIKRAGIRGRGLRAAGEEEREEGLHFVRWLKGKRLLELAWGM
jgi:hypothetical protein